MRQKWILCNNIAQYARIALIFARTLHRWCAILRAKAVPARARPSGRCQAMNAAAMIDPRTGLANPLGWMALNS